MTSNPNQKPETRYARSGEVSIAYQVLGRGPRDLVMVPGFPSHLELAWEQPRVAYFYRRLASFSRLILLDKRGIGLSDRVPISELPGVEQRMDDLRAVLDSAGSERAVVVGASDGGPLAALLAATYPERTSRLVLINTFPRRIRTADYPWAPSIADWEAFQQQIREHWGQPLFMEVLAPDLVDDAGFTDWWATFLRQSVSPGAAIAIFQMNALIDIRAVLPAIHVPTLIIHRVGDMVNPVEGARYMAEHIPDAQLLEVAGNDHHPWSGDADGILDAIESFVTGDRSDPIPDRILATLLITDIVDSTDTAARLGDHRWTTLLATHNDVVRTQLARFGGREVNTTGDGFLAVFDGPGRAIRCALAVRAQLNEVGVRIRAGVHTTEVELSGGDIQGLGVHVAARIMGMADPGEIVVSSVVRDIGVGSGFIFVDRGRHQLKGVPGEWNVFSVEE